MAGVQEGKGRACRVGHLKENVEQGKHSSLLLKKFKKTAKKFYDIGLGLSGSICHSAYWKWKQGPVL